MKKLVAILAVLILPVFANASIVGWNCAPDGDGAIVLNDLPSFSQGNGEYTLSMGCTQSDLPAHVQGDFGTDTELDPTVLIAETIDNDTDFAWTGYEFTIGMTKTFTISSVIVPATWSFTIVPTAAGAIPNGGTGFVGKVIYTMNPGGTPIAINDSGTFGFKVSFLGSTSFCTEQTPIPEPATMTLLCMGALALIRRK
jgi:hypothetical protein